MFRVGLSLEVRRLSWIISSSEEGQDERILKSCIKGSRMTSVVKVLKNAVQFWIAAFVTC
jgi:hypothetical protein